MTIESFSNYPLSNNPNNNSLPGYEPQYKEEMAVDRLLPFQIPDASFSGQVGFEPGFSDEPPSVDFNESLNDVNEWANRRISVFSSLDAALSQAMVEAASALSELKLQVEAEARITTTVIVEERERLQHQVEELRLERVRLQDQISEAKRQHDAERARKLAVEREAELVMEASRRERDRVQVEINQLSRQMEEMGQQLQVFFKQRFAELWTQFAKSVAPPETGVVTPSVEQVFGANFDPAAFLAAKTPDTSLEAAFVGETELEPLVPTVVGSAQAEIKKAVTLQQFEDAPTPKVNIVPVVPADLGRIQMQKEAVPADVLLPLEKAVFNQENEIELDESDFVKIFPPTTTSSAADSSGPQDDVGGSSPRKAKQEQARQHVERLLNKRSNRPAHPVEAGEVQPPSKTERRRRRAEQDREFFKELGSLLGVEAVTPPPSNQMFFAEGFTPPPEVSNFLAGMQASPEIEPLRPATPRSRSNRRKKPLEIAPTSVEDILTQIPADLPVETAADEVFGEDAPTIGELGPDFAQRWDESQFIARGIESPLEDGPAFIGKVEPDITPKNEVSSDSIRNITPTETWNEAVEPEIDNIIPFSVEKLGFKSLQPPRPSSLFDGFPFPLMTPPGANPINEGKQDNALITKIYVVNLQGLSLLSIEKVIRGLPGVYQVVVTTLDRGEIGMEVRHHPELELDKVLPNLPDFKLKLVERSADTLKFMQR